MNMKHTLLAAALLATGGFSAAGLAASPATTTFQVSIKINSACTVTAQNLAFSAVDANVTADQTASNANGISVTCSKGTPYNIGLQPSSANGGTTAGTGSMAGAATGNTDKIAYTLYSNSGYSTVWGNQGVSASAVGNGVAGIPSTDGKTAKVYPVYAKVLGTNLAVTPDTYTDTVAVSVYY
jgi:spore coat protein U-like protein